MMKRREFLLASAGGLVAAPFVKTSAFAAGYPDKSVRWLVGYVPGGTTDILARLIGAYLSEKTGWETRKVKRYPDARSACAAFIRREVEGMKGMGGRS